MRYTDNQKKVLELLLDTYEKSKTYQGTNVRQQSFSIKPDAVWKDYTSDYANVLEVNDFENELKVLEKENLITLSEKAGIITKITACKGLWDAYYRILERTSKRDYVQEQISFYEHWKSKDIPVVLPFCTEQLEKLHKGQKPDYEKNFAEKLFQILEYMLNNTEDIFERELSIYFLSDSKLFVKGGYRSKVCKLIQKYLDFSERLQGVDESKEQEKIILEEFHVFANPSYVYLKGDMQIQFSDGRIFELGEAPIALSSDAIKKLESVIVRCDTVVTIENLTSFHRLNETNCAYVFLSGYHNSVKQSFLKKIYKENPHKKWMHFGDIDPDGFYILEHLKRGTGIAFEPLWMGREELERYTGFCRKLEQNDRVKAENLISKGLYVEVLKYMLRHNVKLEQEIICSKKS